MSAPAPYPADTKAKGWRFELDLEQVMQSDTWALAGPEVRPWLLMLWTTAWQQIPCGSMPSDDVLIAARLGMPIKAFQKAKAVLLRGWWLADDGRLYHDTIASRVHDMLGRKDAERQRKAEYRARKEAERRLLEIAGEDKDTQCGPKVSHGTDMGRTRESGGGDATGTGTGTGLDSSNPPPPVGVDNLTEGKKPETPVTTTAAGRICKLMKQAGLQQVNPGNVTLKVLIEAGATDAEFVEAAQAAVKKGAGFSYALSVVTNERKRAAELVGQIKHGAMGGKPDPLQDPDSRESIEAAGVELGLGKWVAFDSATGRSEPWPAYAARVRRAQGRAPSAEAAQLGNLVLASIGQRATRQTAAMGGA